MSFFAVLFALMIEQLKPLPRHNWVHDTLISWTGWAGRNFDAGRDRHAIVVWCVTVLAPAIAAALIYWAIERVSLLGALVRSFALLLDGALFGLVAYVAMDRSPLRQRLGDRWGDTLVVHRRAMPQLAPRIGQIALGNGIGLAVFAFLCAYSIVVRASAAAGIVL